MLDSIESALEDIRNGKLVIVVDDEDRENEGDFITAARNVTPEVVNFMSTHGRGLICAASPKIVVTNSICSPWWLITPPCMKLPLRSVSTCWGMGVRQEYPHTTGL